MGISFQEITNFAPKPPTRAIALECFACSKKEAEAVLQKGETQLLSRGEEFSSKHGMPFRRDGGILNPELRNVIFLHGAKPLNQILPEEKTLNCKT